MADSEQRPTDVEGHSYRGWQDTEAVDDDRGSRLPDDVEGHSWRSPSQDTEAVDQDRGLRNPDDTEGHGRSYQDTGAVDEDQVGDDTEGHIRY